MLLVAAFFGGAAWRREKDRQENQRLRKLVERMSYRIDFLQRTSAEAIAERRNND